MENALFITLVSLFTTVNPVGASLILVGHPNLTEDKASLRRVARRASIASFLALTSFAIGGEFLFRMMGITIPAFQIAGGILVFSIALGMMKGANVRARTLPEEQEDAMHKEDISIIPLAIPLLSGPGSITLVIVLMAQSKDWMESAALIVSILVVSVATYFILSRAPRILRLMGPSGVRVMNRVMGLIVAAIAVQFLINGLIRLAPLLSKAASRG